MKNTLVVLTLCFASLGCGFSTYAELKEARDYAVWKSTYIPKPLITELDGHQAPAPQTQSFHQRTEGLLSNHKEVWLEGIKDDEDYKCVKKHPGIVTLPVYLQTKAYNSVRLLDNQ